MMMMRLRMNITQCGALSLGVVFVSQFVFLLLIELFFICLVIDCFINGYGDKECVCVRVFHTKVLQC